MSSLILATVLLAPTVSRADPITHGFSGQVSSILAYDFSPFPGLAVGMALAGTFTYETDTGAYDPTSVFTNSTVYVDELPFNGFFAWQLTIKLESAVSPWVITGSWNCGYRI